MAAATDRFQAAADEVNRLHRAETYPSPANRDAMAKALE